MGHDEMETVSVYAELLENKKGQERDREETRVTIRTKKEGR